MLIPLRGPDGGKLAEWALVELQGKIEPQRAVQLQESLVVGTLQLSQSVRRNDLCRAAAHWPPAPPLPASLSPIPLAMTLLYCCIDAALQSQDVVVLQVGYHQLEGKRVPLKKPLAILEQQLPQQQQQQQQSRSPSPPSQPPQLLLPTSSQLTSPPTQPLIPCGPGAGDAPAVPQQVCCKVGVCICVCVCVG